MCGRYVRRGDKQKIAEHFVRCRTRPSCQCRTRTTTWHRQRTSPIIRQSRETGGRELILARWGLVPFFTKDLKEIKGLSTINAHFGDDHQGSDVAGTVQKASLLGAGLGIFRTARLPEPLSTAFAP